MTERTPASMDSASGEIVPPPRRRRHDQSLHLNAVQVIRILGLLPLATSIVAFALLSRWRLPSTTRKRGHPLVYSDASILLIALLARLWHLSSREVCLWLRQWPALALACGLPTHRVIDPGHFTRRVKKLGAYPFWLLYLVLVWRGLRLGLLTGRDVVIDSSLLAAWTPTDPGAAWSFPSSVHGYVFGYKVHVLLDRAARLPLFFLLSPANRNDLPGAYPLLALGRLLFALPIHIVRADGAYWGKGLVHFIVAVIGAHPIIPFNRKKQSLAHARHLVYWPLSYLARAIIERFFAAAKRYYGLDTRYHVGWDAVLLQVALTFCAILVVALVAHHLGRPDLRLSPTRVLAHYLPVERTP
jgi:hypothetical protein